MEIVFTECVQLNHSQNNVDIENENGGKRVNYVKRTHNILYKKSVTLAIEQLNPLM